jgi:hypothetical protein
MPIQDATTTNVRDEARPDYVTLSPSQAEILASPPT